MADKFIVDSTHTSIGFGVKHMMVTTVRGRFTEFAGEIEVEGEDPTTARGTVTIQTASIDTQNEQRDAHLRSADFFDAAQYPEVTYTISGVTKNGDSYRVNGDLTMHGVTRPVELTVAVEDAFLDPFGNQRIGIAATGTLNRTEWGLTWNQTLEAGRLLVSEQIKLEIEAALVRPVAVPSATTA